MPKKKKCLKGLSCGFACIKQSLWCAKELGPKPKAVLDKMVQLIGEPEIVTYAPALIKSLGKGEFGEVSLTENGTAYKAFFPALPKSGYDEDGDWYDEDDEPLVRTNSAAEEVKIATELGKAGIAPPVISIRKLYGETLGFEMGLLKDHTPT